MRRTTPPSVDRRCVRCSGAIPVTRRADAAYCSVSCVGAAEKARYCVRNPAYVARQRRQSAAIRHLHAHGHTHFLDSPLGNPRDRFRVARALGYRSMLEVNVARQLEAAGIDARACYERVTLTYFKPAC